MQYMRIECDSCKQELVLPIEVRQEDCRCPSCGKTVAIPPHDAPPPGLHERVDADRRIRRRVINAAAQKNYTVLKQAGINVIGPFPATTLFDYHRNQLV